MQNIVMLVLKRVGLAVVTLFVISVMIFVGVEALPGDLATAILGKSATVETVAAFRKELKLDIAPHLRYLNWVSDFVKGDFGNSLANGQPVGKLIGKRFRNTIFLATLTAAVSVPFSIILGMLAAIYRDSWFDRFISVTTLTFISFPEFFFAYILIAILSVEFNIFPSMSNIKDGMPLYTKIFYIILPCLTLTLVVLAHMMRMTRAAIINVLNSPYIEMAKLKGISPARIIVHHATPNALSPIINVVILNLAYLTVGVVVIEVVFVYPGLGRLLVDSVAKRDIPIVQASGLIFACTYITLNMLADVLSMLSNPKLRNPC
jgi:peptide/nickel transport system permease protein